MKLQKLPNELIDNIISYISHCYSNETPYISKEFFKAHLYRITIGHVKFSIYPDSYTSNIWRKLTKSNYNYTKPRSNLALDRDFNIIDSNLYLFKKAIFYIDTEEKRINHHQITKLVKRTNITNLTIYNLESEYVKSFNLYIPPNITVLQLHNIELLKLKIGRCIKKICLYNTRISRDVILGNSIEHIELENSTIHFTCCKFNKLKYFKYDYRSAYCCEDWIKTACNKATDFVSIPEFCNVLCTLSKTKGIKSTDAYINNMNKYIEYVNFNQHYNISHNCIKILHNYEYIRHLKLKYIARNTNILDFIFEHLETIDIKVSSPTSHSNIRYMFRYNDCIHDLHKITQKVRIFGKNVKSITCFNCDIIHIESDNIKTLNTNSCILRILKFPDIRNLQLYNTKIYLQECRKSQYDGNKYNKHYNMNKDKNVLLNATISNIVSDKKSNRIVCKYKNVLNGSENTIYKHKINQNIVYRDESNQNVVYEDKYMSNKIYKNTISQSKYHDNIIDKQYYNIINKQYYSSHEYYNNKIHLNKIEKLDLSNIVCEHNDLNIYIPNVHKIIISDVNNTFKSKFIVNPEKCCYIILNIDNIRTFSKIFNFNYIKCKCMTLYCNNIDIKELANFQDIKRVNICYRKKDKITYIDNVDINKLISLNNFDVNEIIALQMCGYIKVY